MTITKHYTIIGNVQHVGYRDFVKEAADKAQLTGMANHAQNGDVLVIAQGDAETFPAFERALRFGPVMAFVKSVKTELVDKSAYYRSFQVEGRVLSTPLTDAIKQVQQETNDGLYDTDCPDTIPQQQPISSK